MKQEEYLRLLPVEGAYNMRDLGGYPAAGHKHVKWKTFIRSGDLNKLTESDLAYLASLSIRIDFRSIQEKKVAADRIPATVTQYIPLSIEAGDMTDMAHFNLNNIPKILEQAYVYIIQNAQDTYREFFRIVSEERNTPISLFGRKRPYRYCRRIIIGSIGCRQKSDYGRLYAVCQIPKRQIRCDRTGPSRIRTSYHRA
jgi:protein-tyrosine phosphatase